MARASVVVGVDEEAGTGPTNVRRVRFARHNETLAARRAAPHGSDITSVSATCPIASSAMHANVHGEIVTGDLATHE